MNYMAIKCQLSNGEEHVTLHIRQSCLSDDHQNPKYEEKSNTLIVPLLLEDNSTLTGGAACLDEFGREFKKFYVNLMMLFYHLMTN